jgi:hypothetical protein
MIARYPVGVSESTVCSVCGGSLWVCEDHIDKPWGEESDREDACHCGGAGVPCPACNPSDQDNPPKMPKGYATLVSRDDPAQ